MWKQFLFTFNLVADKDVKIVFIENLLLNV